MRILYLINVDWFFASHFMHLARRAKERGWEVALAAHVGDKREPFERDGLTLIPLPSRRGSLWPEGLIGAARTVADDLRRSPDTILHGFGLFGIVTGTLASRLSGARRRVFYITGRGYTAVAPSVSARMVRAGSWAFCHHVADGPDTRWIAENKSDIESLCPPQAIAEGRTAVVGGAGIDPDVFHPAPFPPAPPLKALLVGRMVWSKGVDLAVEAVDAARRSGADIELSIAGGIDPGNPAGLTQDDMQRLVNRPGIRWLGAVRDIPALWADHHVAILPSRGGEGVPRSLIEAAACGRPIITTDVPGCRELAEATDGIHVPPDDVAALARALYDFARAPRLEARGKTARAAVLATYTEDKNWQAAEKFYAELA